MPKPSPLWYPTSLQEQAAWHIVFNDQAQATGLIYGLTQDEIDQIKLDKDMVVFLAAAINTLDNYDEAIRAFRKDVMESSVDGGTPTFPSNISFTATVGVPRGIWERVIKYADRIKASSGYTIAVGESYGIVPSTPTPISPTLVQPEVQLTAAAHGFLYSVLVSKREESDSWQIFQRNAGDGGPYQMAATGTGKSIDITYSPTDPEKPVQLEVYVQLRKNNENYGQPSEINLVTVNP